MESPGEGVGSWRPKIDRGRVVLKNTFHMGRYIIYIIWNLKTWTVYSSTFCDVKYPLEALDGSLALPLSGMMLGGHHP